MKILLLLLVFLIELTIQESSSTESSSTTKIETTATEQSTTTDEQTTQWIRTKPTENWMNKRDEFTNECYQLGAIDLRLETSYNDTKFGPKLDNRLFKALRRMKRYSNRITTPFTHPKKARATNYACIESFYAFFEDICHRPEMIQKQNCTDSTASTIRPLRLQSLWIISDEVASQPQRWNVTEILEDCCSSVQNQCDCFFQIGKSRTPSEGICAAILVQESGQKPKKTEIITTTQMSTQTNTETSTQLSTTESTQVPSTESSLGSSTQLTEKFIILALFFLYQLN